MKISIITTSLNKVKYIEDAIKSVQNQGYKNLEHIIVDGGSDDGTIDVLKKYPHLKWISSPDKGQSDAMNKGFEMSSGDIIVYLNADDYFLPGALNAVLPYFKQNNTFVVGKVKVIDDNDLVTINDPRIKLEEMLRWWEPNAYCYNPLGYFYTRKVQEVVGGFNTENHYSMDVEFLMEAAIRFSFSKIDRVLGVYRFLSGTKTFETSGYQDELNKLAFCDRYTACFDEMYINDYFKRKNKYLRDRKFSKSKTLLGTYIKRVIGISS